MDNNPQDSNADETAQNDITSLEKLTQSYLLLKQKICRTHDLIKQYNDKVKECERMKTDLDAKTKEVKKVTYNYNSTLAKVIKLELQNTEYKKNNQVLMTKVNDYEIKMAADQQHIQQLICKVKDVEDHQNDKIMQYDLEKSSQHVKIKELEQELKNTKKVYEAKIKKLEKRLSTETDTVKLNKPVEVKKVTSDIGVNTSFIDEEVAPKIETMEKCIMTDEFYNTKDNMYPVFCAKCEVLLEPPPLQKICKIMTDSCPELIEKISSPTKVPSPPPLSPRVTDKPCKTENFTKPFEAPSLDMHVEHRLTNPVLPNSLPSSTPVVRNQSAYTNEVSLVSPQMPNLMTQRNYYIDSTQMNHVSLSSDNADMVTVPSSLQIITSLQKRIDTLELKMKKKLSRKSPRENSNCCQHNHSNSCHIYDMNNSFQSNFTFDLWKKVTDLCNNTEKKDFSMNQPRTDKEPSKIVSKKTKLKKRKRLQTSCTGRWKVDEIPDTVVQSPIKKKSKKRKHRHSMLLKKPRVSLKINDLFEEPVSDTHTQDESCNNAIICTTDSPLSPDNNEQFEDMSDNKTSYMSAMVAVQEIYTIEPSDVGVLEDETFRNSTECNKSIAGESDSGILSDSIEVGKVVENRASTDTCSNLTELKEVTKSNSLIENLSNQSDSEAQSNTSIITEENTLEEHNSKETTLEEHSLEEHSLEEHSLEEHSLDEHSLEEHSLEEHSLEEHNLEEHNWEEQNLEERNLEEQNLEEQNLEEQNLEEHNLEEHNLEEQNLEEQNLEEQNLEEHNMEEHNMEEHNVEEHNVEEQNLEEHNLEEQNLEEQNLEEKNLEKNKEVKEPSIKLQLGTKRKPQNSRRVLLKKLKNLKNISKTVKTCHNISDQSMRSNDNEISHNCKENKLLNENEDDIMAEDYIPKKKPRIAHTPKIATQAMEGSPSTQVKLETNSNDNIERNTNTPNNQLPIMEESIKFNGLMSTPKKETNGDPQGKVDNTKLEQASLHTTIHSLNVVKNLIYNKGQRVVPSGNKKLPSVVIKSHNINTNVSSSIDIKNSVFKDQKSNSLSNVETKQISASPDTLLKSRINNCNNTKPMLDIQQEKVIELYKKTESNKQWENFKNGKTSKVLSHTTENVVKTVDAEVVSTLDTKLVNRVDTKVVNIADTRLEKDIPLKNNKNESIASLPILNTVSKVNEPVKTMSPNLGKTTFKKIAFQASVDSSVQKHTVHNDMLQPSRVMSNKNSGTENSTITCLNSEKYSVQDSEKKKSDIMKSETPKSVSVKEQNVNASTVVVDDIDGDKDESHVLHQRLMKYINEFRRPKRNTKMENRKNQQLRLMTDKFVTKQLERLMDSGWQTSLHLDVIEKLKNISSPRIIAKCIVEYLSINNRYNTELSSTFTPPAPLMTKTQQRITALLMDLKKTKPMIFHYVQAGIEYKLFKLNQSIGKSIVESLSRMYVVLARVQKDREKVRIFCCDALYCLGLNAIPILYIVFTSWPEVFPHYETSKDLIPKCIAHAIYTQQAAVAFPKLKGLKSLVKSFYRYPIGVLSADLLNELFKALEEGSCSGVDAAIILLAKREGTEWTYKNIIRGALLPMIINNRHPNMYKAFCLLGNLMRAFPVQDKDNHVGQIVEQLRDLINSGEGSEEQQEGIISALMSLSRHKFNDVLQPIIKWTPSKPLHPLTIEQFEGFISARDQAFWAAYLKKIKRIT